MPLVARVQELAALARFLEEPKGVFWLQGSEGVGKSALLNEAASMCGPPKPLVVAYAPPCRTNGLEPLAALGAEVAAALASGSKAEAKALTALAAGSGGGAAQFWARVGSLLASWPETAKLASKLPASASYDGEEGPRTRERFDAFVSLLALASEQQPERPTVVFLEHAELLREDLARMFLECAAHLPEGAYVFLSSSVDSLDAIRLNQVAKRSPVGGRHTMLLRGLPPEAIAEWAKHQRQVTLDDAAAQAIYRATGGNPTLVARWLDSPRFDPANATEAEVSSGASLQELLGAFNPEPRRFARQVSVLDFPLDVGGYAKLTRFTPAEVQTHLDTLCATGLMQERRGVTWFRSPAVRQGVYATILPNLIKKYHEQALGVLEDLHGQQLQSSHPNDLPLCHSYAWHLHKAMDYRRGFPAAVRVAQRHMALGHWTAAYDAMEFAAESGRMIGYDEETEALQGNLAVLANLLGLHEKAYAVHRRLAESFRKRGDEVNQVIAFLYLGISAFQLGKLQEAKGALKAYIQLTEATSGSVERFRARMLLGETLLRQGEIEEARALAEEAREFAEEAGAEHQALAYHLEANVLLLTGQADAVGKHEETAALWAKQGRPRRQFRSLFNGAVSALLAGEMASTERLLDAARALQEEGSNQLLAAFLNTLEGLVAMERGDLETAERQWSLAQEASQLFGLRKLEGVLAFLRGGLERETGQLQRAKSRLGASLEQLGGDQFGIFHAQARYHIGVILEAMGETVDALDETRAALELAESLKAEALAAEMKLRLGHLLLATGDTAGGRERLTEATIQLSEAGAEGASAYANGLLELHAGDTPEDWLAHLEQAPQSGDTRRELRRRALALCHRGILKGDREALEQAAAIAREHRMPAVLAYAALQLGELGDPVSYEEAVQAAEAAGDAPLLARARLRLAAQSDTPETLLEQVREAKGTQAAPAATMAALALGETPESTNLPPALLALRQGVAALRNGEHDRATALLREALEGELDAAQRQEALLHLALVARGQRRYRDGLARLAEFAQAGGAPELVAKLREVWRRELGAKLYEKCEAERG